MTSSLPIAPPTPQRRRPKRRGTPVILILGLLAGVTVAGYLALRDPAEKPQSFSIPDLSPAARTTLPFQAPPMDMAQVPELSRKTQIPERMLVAYGKAEERQRQTSPRCGISWTMLAGIGRKESFHGRINNTDVNPDGSLTKPIIGVPLDGSPGFRAIKDTEDGEMDGDTQWDRAVGPMQFLPATWKRYAVRVNDDGQPADPQNVDDAAATAARYLCASGNNNLTSPQGWWKAVTTYNESIAYARDVFSGQDAYARAAAQLP